ncbi:MAG: Ni/Fe hydrogenase subunit alpha [Bacillota bacterium]
MTGRNLNIDLHHVTRVEGHGNIVVDVRDGRLERAEFEIVESPRFFESMLRGRKWHEAPYITSRICGICAVGHAQASIDALEKALGVVPSGQTVRLRKLLFNAEIMQSHWLHLFFLAAPDFFGAGSVLTLVDDQPEVVERALRLKKLANDLADMICGRKVHPIAMKVRGFSSLPSTGQFREIHRRLCEARRDLAATVGLFETLEVPDFENETEYIALHLSDEYAWISGRIRSSEGGDYAVEDYLEVAREVSVPHSTAKHARHARESYMVGALARTKINGEFLRPEARAAAERLGLGADTVNPYMNNAAQLVETVHCLEDSIELVEHFLRQPPRAEPRDVKVRAGRGVGAAEVPRGVLFHDYELDGDGTIVGANCIIPTGQNLANLENDMRALLPQILDRPKEEITRALEMLVRAYDPCISCSTHFLDVTFVGEH